LSRFSRILKILIITFACIGVFLFLETIAFSSGGIPTLQEYLNKVKNAPKPQNTIVVEAINYTSSENASLKKVAEFKGLNDVLLWEKEGGWIEWKVHIPEDGLYNMALLYYTLPGKGLGVELSVLIDGKLPYKEAQKITFPRVWKDVTGIRKDKKGNDLRPKCEEAPRWQKMDFIDTEGFYNKALPFYFTKGEHKIRLVSIREPVALKQLIIYNPEMPPTYNEYINI